MNAIITHRILKSWGACSEGYDGFCRLFPEGATLKAACDGLIADGHTSWAQWLFDHARQSEDFKADTVEGFQNTGDRNTGDQNTGDQNTGDQNTGDRNTGHWNTGDQNTGDQNTGDRNTGHWNTGDRNTGDRNTGDQNTGDQNTGDQNTGDRNTGHWNTGDRNTGHRNTGHWNTGHWNTGHRNTGFFNTVTPDDILAFNKPCKRSDWDKADVPSFLRFQTTEWVYEDRMTDAEKAANPNFYVAQGYLKVIPYQDAFQAAWAKASEADRKRAMALPNFDAAVFREISGIDVGEVA